MDRPPVATQSAARVPGVVRRHAAAQRCSRSTRHSAARSTAAVSVTSCRWPQSPPAWAAAIRPQWRNFGRANGYLTWALAGIDVLLSARRVGPTGFAYGVDMTDEMLELARGNAAKAGASNVEFLKGIIEDVPLADASVDVVISNCVINLSTDKRKVINEMYRVLVPGGRIGISDVVADDHLTPAERAERGSYVGCIAGALSRSEYLASLEAAGFADGSVVFTHPTADGMYSAIIQATKPR